MYILKIEHPVPSFDGWKKAFDSDPIGRQKSGVRRYRILRPTDNENFVMVDLEFNTQMEAESALGALRQLWNRVEGQVMMNPQVRIARVVEADEI